MRAAVLISLLVCVSLGAQQPAQAPPAAPAAPASASQPPALTATCPEMAGALTRLVANDMRVRDWAQLARYRDANRLLSPPAVGDSRVVFMGDSITDAWPQPRYGDFFTTHTSYVGRGISGQTTPQMLIRFRPDVIDLDAKVVVILAGTNDIAGNTGPMSDVEIQNNLASMVELAKAHSIRVVLSSILPVAGYHATTGLPQTTQRPMARIRAINDWMKQYAAKEHHVYLDYFSAMLDASGLMREDLTGDDLHPNQKGYAIMGPLAEAAVKQALSPKP
jgi:lysophospholipase L1-like esterase